jgi:quercetin 2,3-dioxygenase
MENSIRVNKALAYKMGEHSMYQPLPSQEFPDLDPFLLIHHHGPHEFESNNNGLSFGPHPHRGFETLTLIYEGEIEHADSQQFKSTIKKECVQWMTAGSGIVHSENLSTEMRKSGGKMEIIQLWMNLPSFLKMSSPNYQGFQNNEIPLVHSNDNKVHTQVISGVLKNVGGAAHSITNLNIWNVDGTTGGIEFYPNKPDNTCFIYMVSGTIKIQNTKLTKHQLAKLNFKEVEIEVQIESDAKFILAFGKPFSEPVVSQGPFVMNTNIEIIQAQQDYKTGKMGLM